MLLTVQTLAWAFLLSIIRRSQAWLQYAPTGTATLTHYTLPLDYIAACGCTAKSTHYPTAAMSGMAYGSTTAYGPGCGRCFKITLLNTFTSNPPFFPDVTKSVVIKVTDLCPSAGGTWCGATAGHPNPGGQYINFDLAWPSTSIPDDFFPSNASFYGYTDFGVWNVSYESVSCVDDWAGGQDPAALGSVADGSSVCCPVDPFTDPNTTCPSFSDGNAIPPNTTTTGGNTVPLSTSASSLCLLVVTVVFSAVVSWL